LSGEAQTKVVDAQTVRLLAKGIVDRLCAMVRRDKEGQDMIEYALMAAFVAVSVAATFPTSIGPAICTMLSRVGRTLVNASAQGR
jgi:Flp pilus assembly pilin Flp